MPRLCLIAATIWSVAASLSAEEGEKPMQKAEVQRAVFESPKGAQPAAIAVNLGENASFLWDSVECRLMAVWSGNFLAGGKDRVFKPAGKLVRWLESPSPVSVAAGAYVAPEFHGFEIDEGGIPTFHYIVGNLSVSERISLSESSDAAVIGLSIRHSPTNDVMLAFPAEWEKKGAKLSAGKWEDGYVIVPTSGAEDFTLSIALDELFAQEEATEEETPEKP